MTPGAHAFAIDLKIGFQHCDPAGIVFYPRYYEMVNTVIEDWFAQVLGWDFAQLHMQERLAVPTVRIETDFTAPSRLGEVLNWTLEVNKVGQTSLELALQAVCREEKRLQNRSVLVLIGMETGKPQAWPPAIRARLEEQCGNEKK